MKPRDTPTDKLETESNYYRILSDEGSTCSKLATTLKCGGLWPSLCMIKVSPVQDVQPEQSRGEHDICVYNMDYKDTGQVMRVDNLMRFAGSPPSSPTSLTFSLLWGSTGTISGC